MSCTYSDELIEQTLAFHGHCCPGIVIGIRAAELAARELGDPSTIDMVTVAETDMCGVDAIQFITGCTYGKGNFIHRDYGKMAFSFYDRNTGHGIRVRLNPDARIDADQELCSLMKKRAAGSATEDDHARIAALREMQQRAYMALELDKMFTVLPAAEIPRPAQVLENLCCEECGETVMESRTRRYAGRTLCIPCFETFEQKV